MKFPKYVHAFQSRCHGHRNILWIYGVLSYSFGRPSPYLGLKETRHDPNNHMKATDLGTPPHHCEGAPSNSDSRKLHPDVWPGTRRQAIPSNRLGGSTMRLSVFRGICHHDYLFLSRTYNGRLRNVREAPLLVSVISPTRRTTVWSSMAGSE